MLHQGIGKRLNKRLHFFCIIRPSARSNRLAILLESFQGLGKFLVLFHIHLHVDTRFLKSREDNYLFGIVMTVDDIERLEHIPDVVFGRCRAADKRCINVNSVERPNDDVVD